MALGPDHQRVPSITSNAGHLLAAGAVPIERARPVARRLMEPDMFSGWGIRTLSSDHVAYNPFSYHRGSIWPMDTATIALGFARYGFWDELHRLCQGMFGLSDLFVANRLPEAVSGIHRDDMHPHPGIYPNSNEPQAWSASAVILLVQSLLGLYPVAPLGLLLVDPHLPEWLPDLRLDGVRVGDTHLDLVFWRDETGETHCRVAGRDGPVRVLRQPAPQRADSGLGKRLWVALASASHS
jgi:glycogen debranching enzyme